MEVSEVAAVERVLAGDSDAFRLRAAALRGETAMEETAIFSVAIISPDLGDEAEAPQEEQEEQEELYEEGTNNIPILIELARTHRDPAVRKKALFWLGQSDDPRAVEAIEKILLE